MTFSLIVPTCSKILTLSLKGLPFSLGIPAIVSKNL